MDLYCQVCGEPFEAYHLQHDVSEAERDFFYDGFGCAYCKGKIPEGGKPEIAYISAVAHEMLGDDIDGVASIMEDWNYLNQE